MKKHFLDRRTFLRGLYSTAIKLPILDLMLNSHGEAFAQGSAIPKNYFTVFSGIALASGHKSQKDPVLMPYSTGPIGTNLPISLQPLNDHGVRNLVQIASNLFMPYKDKPGGVSNIHGNCHTIQLSGSRKVKTDAIKSYDSPDVIFANSTGGKTPLTIGVQASGYTGGTSTVSIKKKVKLMPKTDLHKLYLDLVSNVSSSDQAQEQRRLFEFKKRGTVLDLVKDDLNQFKKKLGRSDQVKMDRHISSLRDLETQLSNIDQKEIVSCYKMKDPGPDQARGNILDINKWRNERGQQVRGNENYSNEIERAKVAVDLAYMAMSCGINNVVNLVATYNHPWLNAGPITGVYTDFHNLTHGCGSACSSSQKNIEALHKAHAWQINMYASLIKKLKDTNIGTGSLYDQTVGVYFCEAGKGRNYYSDKFYQSANETHYAHSAENMIMLVSGNMGGLKPGKHFNANKQHPTKVFISALKALGVNINTQGEISGRIDELFS